MSHKSLIATVAENNDIEFVRKILSTATNSIDHSALLKAALDPAARLGNRELVNVIIACSKTSTIFTDIEFVTKDAIVTASLEGHHEIVEDLLDTYDDKYVVSDAFEAAASRGHEDVIEVLKQYGTRNDDYFTDYELAIYSAASGGQYETADKLVEFNLDCFGEANEIEMCDDGLHRAASEGDLKAVKYYVSRSAGKTCLDDYTGNCHERRIEMDEQLGFCCDYTEAINKATDSRHTDIVNFLVDYTIRNVFNQTMYNATVRNNIDVVKSMLKLGANSFNDALKVARDNDYTEIVQLLVDA